MIPIHTTRAAPLTIISIIIIAVLGVAPYYSTYTLTAIWLGVFITAFAGFAGNKMYLVWYSIAASPGLEVWSRMAKAPYVPDEIGKYFLLWCILLLLFHHIKRPSPKPQYNIGIIIILFLLPSCIVALANFNYQQWVFNVLGIIEIAALLVFAARERWELETFCRSLQMALVGVVLMLIYLTLKSPGIADIEYTLGSNAAASGGFGSNQVSTVLGAGFAIAVILQLLKRPLFAHNWLNYALIAYLLLRCLLTFSRGGMLVSLAAIFIVYIPYIFASLRSFFRYTGIIIAMSLFGLIVFKIANDITGNMLLQRYAGENFSNPTESKERTWDMVLSGRLKIASSDLEIFQHNILFGAGPGGGLRLRQQYGYALSGAHTEVSRLLGEHGIGGIAVFISLVIFPIIWIGQQRRTHWKGIVAALFALSLFTTFHAAMRTNTSIVFYVLAAIPVLLLRETKKDKDLAN